MAVLMPALNACKSRMTTGERRLAERLEAKLEDDYLLWYDVPIGPKQSHPDFVVLHPRRGLLVLEVKDWKLDTIRRVDRHTWEILSNGLPKSVVNPFQQARHYAHQVVDALARDPQLIDPSGSHQGKLNFPWTYGVVFTHITRQQFDVAELGLAIDPHRVICSDEMTEAVDAEAFQKGLWEMFPFMMWRPLTLPQIDRIRWTMFPEIRIPVQGALFANVSAGEVNEPPDLVRVMDLQQEQLARSLGDGHRVIHGVAGSGKTMILGYRAEYLARAAGEASKPVLVLCYNEPLAVTLDSMIQAKGLGDRVQVRHFHKWCRQQLVTYHQPIPSGGGDRLFETMVQNVIRGVELAHIPSAQYRAVLIDEGHDFASEWLKLVAQMVDPDTQSLLLLYDDAQSIYQREGHRKFSLKSVGIQAQGRTTILRINYRNTRQILETAASAAAQFMQPEEQDDDGIPMLQPTSCGREGREPIVIRLSKLEQDAAKIAELMGDAHLEGRAWGEMAILCRNHETMSRCAAALVQRGYPHQLRRKSGQFDPLADTIKVMTMHASKGLEFPLVAVTGMLDGQADVDASEEARLFYVAATRATEQLIVLRCDARPMTSTTPDAAVMAH